MARQFTIPIALIGGLLLGTMELVKHVKDSPKELRGAAFIHSLTGYWIPSGQFTMNNGGGAATIAIAGGALIHKFVGGSLGVNRALGRARVPIIRL